MARKQHTYTPRTRSLIELLGREIQRARLERRVTQVELAERAGISANTLVGIERGSPTAGIGVVFEVAYLAGLDLLATPEELPSVEQRSRERLALLPSRVRRAADVDDDF